MNIIAALSSLSDTALPEMKYSITQLSFPLSLGLLLISPSYAQVTRPTPNYGRGPALEVLSSPGVAGESHGFSPANGVNCPTPVFSAGGFGAGGNDWANDYSTYDSSGSGINNFGIAAGVRIPFGGELSRYCKSYAKSFSEKMRLEMEQARRTNQVALLRDCYWLLQNKINPDQPLFKDDKAFSSLNVCNDLDYLPLQSAKPLPGSDARSEPKMMELTPPPVRPAPEPKPEVQLLLPVR
jgi:hypothetical protein